MISPPDDSGPINPAVAAMVASWRMRMPELVTPAIAAEMSIPLDVTDVERAERAGAVAALLAMRRLHQSDFALELENFANQFLGDLNTELRGRGGTDEIVGQVLGAAGVAFHLGFVRRLQVVVRSFADGRDLRAQGIIA